MPFNDLAKNTVLNALDETGSTQGGAGLGVTHVGINTLVTAPPSDTTPGTTGTAASTEASGGGYARQAVTWAAAASGQKANSGSLTFDVAAGTYGFATFWNASTGNSGTQYLGYAPINGTVKGFATVDAADVTANTITSAGHGYVNTDRVIFFNVYAESLPTGITEGAAYFVVGATTDTFQISLTSGGAAVDLTAIGEAFHQKVIPEVFASTGQITIAASALVLDATAF